MIFLKNNKCEVNEKFDLKIIYESNEEFKGEAIFKYYYDFVYLNKLGFEKKLEVIFQKGKNEISFFWDKFPVEGGMEVIFNCALIEISLLKDQEIYKRNLVVSIYKEDSKIKRNVIID